MLLEGQLDKYSKELPKYVMETFSYFDLSTSTTEKYYYIFSLILVLKSFDMFKVVVFIH